MSLRLRASEAATLWSLVNRAQAAGGIQAAAADALWVSMRAQRAARERPDQLALWVAEVLDSLARPLPPAPRPIPDVLEEVPVEPVTPRPPSWRCAGCGTESEAKHSSDCAERPMFCGALLARVTARTCVLRQIKSDVQWTTDRERGEAPEHPHCVTARCAQGRRVRKGIDPEVKIEWHGVGPGGRLERSRRDVALQEEAKARLRASGLLEPVRTADEPRAEERGRQKASSRGSKGKG